MYQQQTYLSRKLVNVGQIGYTTRMSVTHTNKITALWRNKQYRTKLVNPAVSRITHASDDLNLTCLPLATQPSSGIV